MAKVISIHSFRGGTGKSNISANLSYLLAAREKKVCIIDTDIQSPGIHILFKLKEPPKYTLNDFLWGRAPIEAVAMDVSQNVGLPRNRSYLIPCSMDLAEITRVLKEGYDVARLTNGFREISERLSLDYLVIDTHPGLNEETLLSIALSDILFIIMRPDQQDFQGTSVTVEVAKRLKVGHIMIIVNKVLSYYDPSEIKRKVEGVYGCKVAGVLPLTEKMVELGSTGLYVRAFPDDPWSKEMQNVAELVLNLD